MPRAFSNIHFSDPIKLVQSFALRKAEAVVSRILVGKSGGLFIGMPSKKGKDGKYYDQIEFKVNDFQSELRTGILEAYKVFAEV